MYQALLDAPSEGGYFNRIIRGRYPYRALVYTIRRRAEWPAGCGQYEEAMAHPCGVAGGSRITDYFGLGDLLAPSDQT
jgi:hypothetical protein